MRISVDLPQPRGADEHAELAMVDVEIDAVNDLNIAIALDDLA